MHDASPRRTLSSQTPALVALDGATVGVTPDARRRTGPGRRGRSVPAVRAARRYAGRAGRPRSGRAGRGPLGETSVTSAGAERHHRRARSRPDGRRAESARPSATRSCTSSTPPHSEQPGRGRCTLVAECGSGSGSASDACRVGEAAITSSTSPLTAVPRPSQAVAARPCCAAPPRPGDERLALGGQGDAAVRRCWNIVIRQLPLQQPYGAAQRGLGDVQRGRRGGHAAAAPRSRPRSAAAGCSSRLSRLSTTRATPIGSWTRRPGSGPNVVAAHPTLRRGDPTRPIHRTALATAVALTHP